MQLTAYSILQAQLGLCAVADSARTNQAGCGGSSDASDRVGGGCKALEAEHGTGSGLDPTMILLDQVVSDTWKIASWPVRLGSRPGHLGPRDRSMRRGIAIEGDVLRAAPALHA